MSVRAKVLVVNDVQEQRQRIVRVIGDLCEVVAPETHEDLRMELFASTNSPYALVLLDYHFLFWSPKEKPRNGADVVEHLYGQRGARPPVIILFTNYPREPEVRHLAHKYHLHVVSPTGISMGELRQAVQALVA